MATQRTANVFITNQTDGNAQIQLSHQNDSNGNQAAAWTAAPGQTVGPLVVHFETGIGSWGILDWWAVAMTVENGSTPGIYQNTGTPAFPHWKECPTPDRRRQQGPLLHGQHDRLLHESGVWRLP
jgi:phospholipase C